jgi:hypothetical protein
VRAVWFRSPMEQNKPTNPLKIRFLCPTRQLLEPHYFPTLIQEFQLAVRFHQFCEFPDGRAFPCILFSNYNHRFFHIILLF